MKFKNKDAYVEYFCNYIQWKEERGDDISLKRLGAQMEQAGWITDIMISLVWLLIKKGILKPSDLKEIFWHGEGE